MTDLSQVLANAGLTPDQIAVVMAQFQSSISDPLAGTGIESKIEGNILTLKIDLSKNKGLSSTGKSTIVASTGGFRNLLNGMKLNVVLTKA